MPRAYLKYFNCCVLPQVSESVEQSAALNSHHSQPILVIQGGENFEGNVGFSLVCEGMVCSAGSTFAESLDMLYKMFWVFQWEYPKGTKLFFKFLQKVYKMSFGNERVPSKVEEIFCTVR